MTFKVGDRVALISGSSGWGPRIITEAHVAKVYANGNFVLKDRAGQWRQSGSVAGGTGWRSGRVELWTKATDAEIAAQHARRQRIAKVRKLEALLARSRNEADGYAFTKAQELALDALLAELNPLKLTLEQLEHRSV